MSTARAIDPANRRSRLHEIAREQGIVVAYLLGSRAADGLRHLDGGDVSGEGSDLDVAVLLHRPPEDPLRYGALCGDLSELFAPLRADVAMLHEADPFFQEAAIRGIELACTDEHARDEFEIYALARAGDLLPIQRALELEMYGRTNR